jgi:hypothetical protein
MHCLSRRELLARGRVAAGGAVGGARVSGASRRARGACGGARSPSAASSTVPLARLVLRLEGRRVDQRDDRDELDAVEHVRHLRPAVEQRALELAGLGEAGALD